MKRQLNITGKMNYAACGISTQSAGVIILYDNSYKCLESCLDGIGRLIILVIENDLEKFIICNVYCPCDSDRSLEFMQGVYDKLY